MPRLGKEIANSPPQAHSTNEPPPRFCRSNAKTANIATIAPNEVIAVTCKLEPLEGDCDEIADAVTESESRRGKWAKSGWTCGQVFSAGKNRTQRRLLTVRLIDIEKPIKAILVKLDWPGKE